MALKFSINFVRKFHLLKSLKRERLQEKKEKINFAKDLEF